MGECLITRRGGETYKLPILDANYPENVTITVIQGNTASATFTAVIDEPGNPAIYSYQWYYDGVAVEGATSSSYTVEELAEAGSHTIYCEVTNKKGTVTTRIATLDVSQLYTPTLEPYYPQNATVSIHNSVTCEVMIETDGNPAEYTYQWYKNDVAISGATESSYSFTPTALGSIDLYCKVTNSAGTVTSRTATVDVTYLYLFNSGDQCIDVTGGWKADATNADTEYEAGTPSLTITDVMRISKAESVSKRRGSVYPTKNYFDFSKYTALCVVLTQKADEGGCSMTITTKSGNNYATGTIATLNLALKTAGTWSIDLSSINRSAYFYFATTSDDGEPIDVRIKQVYLK